MTDFEFTDTEARILHACLFDHLTVSPGWRKLDTPEAWALEARLRRTFNHVPAITARWQLYQEDLAWRIEAAEAKRVLDGEERAEKIMLHLVDLDDKRWGRS